VTRDIEDDPARKARIEEYLKRRATVRDRGEELWRLALWCEQNGLKQQATAHLYQVLRLDPTRDAAWKHLGFKRLGGHWDKPERVAAAKAAAREQQKANNQWKPILEKYRSALLSKDASRRPEAEKGLSEIKDPLAVPMVWATFARGNAALQQAAVLVFSQIDDPTASRGLVMLAVFSGSKDVRGKAIAELRRRDRREYAATLIAMILRPIKYTAKPVGGPGKPGELLIKGSGSTPNLKRIYAPPGTDPAIAAQAGDRVRLDADGLPVLDRVTDLSLFQMTGSVLFAWQQMAAISQQEGLQALQQQSFQSMITNSFSHSGLGLQGQKIGNLLINTLETTLKQPPSLSLMNNPYYVMGITSQNGVPVNPGSLLTYTVASGVEIPTGRIMLQAQKTAAMAQQQLQNDVAAIDQFNSSLNEINDRVLPVLNSVSGLNLGPDPAAWQTWLNNLVGFNSQRASEPPTVVENVSLAYQPDPIPLGSFSGPISVSRISCFGGGTMVRTLTGLEPIESLKVGDQVLTQSSKTGALSYKPILVVHHNPPSKTYNISLGKETIVSSYFHRFWKAGAGWVMARDLKEGDRIRTLNGTVKVTAIEEGKVVPVFNLDVADDADFFVGNLGALAHDNTVPNLRELPFDAATTVGTDPHAATHQPRL